VNIPKDLYYTNDHEWTKFNGSSVIIGITDFAQSELGDIIYIEFPSIGQELIKDQPFGTIEAVKTVADLNAPVSGIVTAINDSLDDSPELVNSDPYGDGWMIKIEASGPSEKELLLSPEAYVDSLE
jgi:glycine cleavage system H protein